MNMIPPRCTCDDPLCPSYCKIHGTMGKRYDDGFSPEAVKTIRNAALEEAAKGLETNYHLTGPQAADIVRSLKEG